MLRKDQVYIVFHKDSIMVAEALAYLAIEIEIRKIAIESTIVVRLSPFIEGATVFQGGGRKGGSKMAQPTITGYKVIAYYPTFEIEWRFGTISQALARKKIEGRRFGGAARVEVTPVYEL